MMGGVLAGFGFNRTGQSDVGPIGTELAQEQFCRYVHRHGGRYGIRESPAINCERPIPSVLDHLASLVVNFGFRIAPL